MGDAARRDRVLVVEDNEMNAVILRKVLQREGYDVDIAADGLAAFEAVVQQSPDLIFLDAHLPSMSGLDVCRTLRRMPEARSTPIIFLTGMDTDELRTAAIEAGATQFLGKPFDTAELRERVRLLLSA